jgi:hypothetical protein
MEDGDVPPVVDYVEDVALVVRAFNISREEIAADSVMPKRPKGITNSAAVFTADQNAK